MPEEDGQASSAGSYFRESRWFTRGWTLQELIAPTNLDFYSANWESIGSRSSLAADISEITGVDPFVLAGRDIKQVKVARRMYWASYRQTTRLEDAAYCLMGMFDVNMPIVKRKQVMLTPDLCLGLFDLKRTQLETRL